MASNKTNTKGVVVVAGGISKEKQIKVICENNLNSVVLELVLDFFMPSVSKFFVTLDNQGSERLQLF